MRTKVLWVSLVFLVGTAGTDIAARYVPPYLRSLMTEAARDALALDAVDTGRHRERDAARQTADFISQHMPKTPVFPDKFALFDHSVRAVDPQLEGHFCEFGVASGTTINYIAGRTTRTVHGFDSFEGLPEDWKTGVGKGTFAVDGLPRVRDNVCLHKGWFDQSVPIWAAENPGPVAFLHMDADLYSSTKTVFDILGDRIVPGTVIQFDEYFNYPGWQEGEYKAFKEYTEQRRVEFEYIGYTDLGFVRGGRAPSVPVDGAQVAVRIRAIGEVSTR